MTSEQKKRNTAKNKIRKITKELMYNPNNTMAQTALEKWRKVT